MAANNWSWKSYTSMVNITDMCIGNSLLWIGTQGGLLAINHETGGFSAWTNTEGLESNQVTAVTCDSSGRVWIGYNNGAIQRYNQKNSEWLSIDAYKDHQITCLTLSGDTLFVGLDIGVSLYLISRKEVKETYRKLGQLFQVDIPVNQILVNGKKIWVATDEGIAHSELDNVNLMDPESWSNITVNEGLPHNTVLALTSFEDNIYTSTPGGLGEWDGNQWSVSFSNSVFDCIIHEETLIITTENGVFKRQNGNWIQMGTEIFPVQKLISAFSILWGGTSFGITFYSQSQDSWQLYLPDCMGSNLVTDITADNLGRLWVCSRDNGFSMFNGVSWTIYNSSNLPDLLSNEIVAVSADHQNNVWLGSWGKGLVKVNQDSSFQFFHSGNGYLSGISADPNYSVVSDITVDQSGTVWILNREALNYQPLVAITSSGVWTYFGLNDGLFTNFLRVITIDNTGKIWIGTDTQGIIILDTNNTPSDKTDDSPVDRITTSNGLGSNAITALDSDREGIVWIGTSNGLYYYESGILHQKYGLPSDNVTSLTVDGTNNVWVSTQVGVSLFSNQSYSWLHFTEQNSGLISNNVTSLCFDQNSGFIYIGTGYGISVLSTPFSEPKDDLSELIVYPNPFKPSVHRVLTIDNLSTDVSVHIFSSSGYLVKSFVMDEIYGKQIFWDGTNEMNVPVSGGIYLLVAHMESGERKVGKIALVR